MIRLDSVITRVNTKEDKDNTILLYYVGGEHIDSQELAITKKGIIRGSTIGPMFYCGFKKGDVLFVSRNPHLKKAAKVDFDGICSEKTFVLGTKNESVLLQDYIPIILQTDAFWQYCEDNKSGGVNYFINWSTLAAYEFELPTIEEQKEIADKVWAAYRLKESYKKMIESTDEMVKSRFIEMSSKPDVPEMTLAELGTIGTGNTPSKQVNEYWDGDYPWVSAQDMEGKYIHSTIEGLTQSGKGKATIVPANSILYVCRGSIGKMSINKIECGYNQSICSFHSDTINAEYVYHCLLNKEQDIKNQGVGTSFNSISKSEFAKIKIPVLDTDGQKEFVAIVQQADKSKFELREAIKRVESMMKSLIN